MSVQATRSTSILRHDLIGKVCSEVTRATAVSLSPSGVVFTCSSASDIFYLLLMYN